MPAQRRFVVDTSLYVDALRTEAGNDALSAFVSAYAPFVYMSAVVTQELRAGVRGRDASRFEAAIVEPFERRGRLVTPSYAAWKEAGRVLAELIAPSGWRQVTRSFVNDVLLAMSCRETGAILVTSNLADFARIASVRAVDYVPPWPVPPRLSRRRNA